MLRFLLDRRCGGRVRLVCTTSARDEHAALLASALCARPPGAARAHPFLIHLCGRRAERPRAPLLRPALISALIGNGEGRARLRANAQIFLFFFALAPARVRAHTRTTWTDGARRSESACRTFLQVGITFSNANIYPQDMRRKRAGRPRTGGPRAGLPRFPPRGVCRGDREPRSTAV